jgi:hypothetical protein
MVLLSSCICTAQSTNETEMATVEATLSDCPASIDDLFGDTTIAQLPPPTFSMPSPFMIWLRSVGVSMLCGYHDWKEWMIRNYKRLFYIAPRLP